MRNCCYRNANSASQNIVIVYKRGAGFIFRRSLISDDKMSCVLICVCAAEIGLVICRKPHHIERLCAGYERERSHLTAIRDRSCFSFLFFFSATVYSCDQEGVIVPLMLQASPVVLLSIVPLSIFSFTSPNPGYATQESHTI